MLSDIRNFLLSNPIIVLIMFRSDWYFHATIRCLSINFIILFRPIMGYSGVEGPCALTNFIEVSQLVNKTLLNVHPFYKLFTLKKPV